MDDRQAQTSYRRAVEQGLLEQAQKVFDKDETVNSMLLSLSQYWNDEAEDEVHLHLTFSRRHTPLFSHRCRWEPSEEPDFCDYCHEGLPHSYGLRYPEGEEADLIESFEAFCREDCHQEMNEAEAYVPYAIVRRSGGLERVGRLVRTWDNWPTAAGTPASGRERELLASVYAAPAEDGPRAVLADWWIEQGDPRGELVALQLQRDLTPEQRQREAELLREHETSLLGPLVPAVLEGSAVFRRGLLYEAEVSFDSESQAALLHEPAWGTVERLHFLEEDLLSPAMRALRVVSGVSEDGLRDAVDHAHAYGVEDLAVSFSVVDAWKILKSSSAFPELSRLEGQVDDKRALLALLRALPQTVRCVGVTEMEMSFLPELLDALGPGRTLECVARPDQGRLAGWRVQLSREGQQTRMRCVLDNLRADASLATLRPIREALGGDVAIELVPSRYYDPQPGDLDRITAGDPDDG